MRRTVTIALITLCALLVGRAPINSAHAQDIEGTLQALLTDELHVCVNVFTHRLRALSFFSEEDACSPFEILADLNVQRLALRGGSGLAVPIPTGVRTFEVTQPCSPVPEGTPRLIPLTGGYDLRDPSLTGMVTMSMPVSGPGPDTPGWRVRVVFPPEGAPPRASVFVTVRCGSND